MSTALPNRDERTESVENASYRLSYLTLSFGLLVISAYRSFVFHEATWDLLALVIVAGGINAVYQASRRVLYPRWAAMAVVTFVVAALLAVGMVLVGAWTSAPALKPTAPVTETSQTPSQFYLEYRAAFDKATRLDDILPFMAAHKRQQAEAMPALVRDLGFPAMKSMNAVTSLTILKEDIAGDNATLTVEGVSSGKSRTGTVTVVRESGAWKIGGESWK